jgi:hypothetical protein
MFVFVYQHQLYTMFTRNISEYDQKFLFANYFGRDSRREKLFAVNHMNILNTDAHDSWWLV